jgi:hypothetical protein
VIVEVGSCITAVPGTIGAAVPGLLVIRRVVLDLLTDSE